MTRPSPFRHAPGTVLSYRRDGRPIYPIAGAAEGDTPPAETPPAADPPKPTPPPAPQGTSVAELIAERDKWQAMAQKHENRAKENAEKAKGYDELKRQTQTETERAVSDARAEGRREAFAETRGVLARSAVVAAAAREQVQVSDAVLDRLNLADLVGEDNTVDEAAVKELVAGFAPLEQAPPESTPPRGRVTPGQGSRSSTKDRGGSVAAGRDLWAERHQKKT